MHRAHFLIVTAIIEAATGCLLLIAPSVLLALLLGLEHASPETFVCARIAGAALLTVGLACWFGRSEQDSSARVGLLVAVLIYDVAAAAILAYTGWFQNLAGIALWPAVAAHAGLAGCCIVAIRGKRREVGSGSNLKGNQ